MAIESGLQSRVVNARSRPTGRLSRFAEAQRRRSRLQPVLGRRPPGRDVSTGTPATELHHANPVRLAALALLCEGVRKAHPARVHTRWQGTPAGIAWSLDADLCSERPNGAREPPAGATRRRVGSTRGLGGDFFRKANVAPPLVISVYHWSEHRNPAIQPRCWLLG